MYKYFIIFNSFCVIIVTFNGIVTYWKEQGLRSHGALVCIPHTSCVTDRSSWFTSLNLGLVTCNGRVVQVTDPCVMA